MRWPWGSRHTVQSWLGRYRSNIPEFNRRIEAYYQNHAPPRDKHNAGTRNRRANRKSANAKDRSSRQTPIQGGSVEPDDPEAKGSEEGANEDSSDDAEMHSKERKLPVRSDESEEELDEDALVEGNDIDPQIPENACVYFILLWCILISKKPIARKWRSMRL